MLTLEPGLYIIFLKRTIGREQSYWLVFTYDETFAPLTRRSYGLVVSSFIECRRTHIVLMTLSGTGGHRRTRFTLLYRMMERLFILDYIQSKGACLLDKNFLGGIMSIIKRAWKFVVNSMVLALACGAALAAVGQAAPIEVPIGFAGPMSTKMTQTAKDGVVFAIFEANQRLLKLRRTGETLQFKLLVQDDKADDNIAGFAAQYFIKSNVAGVIGHTLTGQAIATASAYEQRMIPQLMFTASGDEFTKLGYQTTFRLFGSSTNTAFYLAESAVDILQARRVAVIDNETPFSKSLAAAFMSSLRAKSAKAVYYTTLSAKTSDFNAALKEIIASRADLIFFSANLSQVQAFVDSALRLKVTARFLLTAGAVNQQFSETTYAGLSGIYTLEPDSISDSCKSWQNFQQRYVRKFGVVPTSFARNAYNATTVLIEAIRKADSIDPGKITEVLHRDHFGGLSGEVAFAKDGSALNHSYTLYERTRQQWTPTKTFSSGPPAACPK